VADGAKTIDRIRERFPDAVVADGSYRDQHWAELSPDSLLDVCRWLLEDPEAAYDVLLDVTAVHWPEDEAGPFTLVYHLYSTHTRDRLRLKVRASEEKSVPSVTAIWPAADWNERETFDMFGIIFDGHPDLRRILMPDEYTDHPLLKEFPLYRG
jgi:NADH-quinone oxidoreductase subunit C